MKRWLFVLLMAVACAPDVVSAQDTAYKALRALGAQRGEKALGQVTAIVGHSGRPQPVDWEITLEDPTARGGVRELDIVSGLISSERAPRSSSSGSTPIELTKLNLDSDGAFRTAEKEASRNQVGFDSANYRLSADAASGQPVWTVEMFDYEQRPVGTVRIAANSGTLLSSANWVLEDQDARYQRPQGRSESGALTGPPPPANGVSHPPADYHQPEYHDRRYDSSDSDSDEQRGATIGERANRFGSSVVQFGQGVAHKTTRIFQTVGGWFQEKFTGRNTIDPKHGQDDDSDQEEPADQYSRPTKPAPPQD